MLFHSKSRLTYVLSLVDYDVWSSCCVLFAAMRNQTPTDLKFLACCLMNQMHLNNTFSSTKTSKWGGVWFYNCWMICLIISKIWPLNVQSYCPCIVKNWMVHLTCYWWMSGVSLYPIKASLCFLHQETLYPHCSVLVGLRNEF